MKKKLLITTICFALCCMFAAMFFVSSMTVYATGGETCSHSYLSVENKTDTGLTPNYTYNGDTSQHGWTQFTSPTGNEAYDMCRIYGGGNGESQIVMSINDNPEECTIPVSWYRSADNSAGYGYFKIQFLLDGIAIEGVGGDYTSANSPFTGWKTENITIPAGNHTLIFSVNKTRDGIWAGGITHGLEIPKINSFNNGVCALCGYSCPHEEFLQNFDTEYHWLVCEDADGCQQEIPNSRSEHTYANGICTGCVYTQLLTEEDDGKTYYQIGNAQQLLSFAKLVENKNTHINAKLTADINMKGITSFKPIGTEQFPFEGIFNGQGHRIFNLNVNMPDTDYVGFLGAIRGVTVKNIVLDKSCSFVGRNYVSAFGTAAGAGGCLFEKCGNEADITATQDYAIGIATNNGNFINCYCTATITAQNGTHVSGMTDHIAWITIERCYFAGELKANGASVVPTLYWNVGYYDDTNKTYSLNHSFAPNAEALTDGTLLAEFGSEYQQGATHPILFAEPQGAGDNHEHAYSITYEWLDDGEKCKAIAICNCNGVDSFITETVDATIVNQGSVAGSSLYRYKHTASFTNVLFTTQNKDFYKADTPGHIHDGKTFAAWNSTNSLPTTSGSYYLTNDVTLGSSQCVISSGADIDLCLNGHVVTLNGTGGGNNNISINLGATLNLYDCGIAEHKFTVDTNGLWTLNESATENYETVTGGVITGGINGIGGAIYLSWSDSNGAAGATLNMYGGNIVGNQSTSTSQGGGAVFVDRPSTFNMSGGKIIGNTAKNGGAVFIFSNSGKHGTFNMSDGEIRINKATEFGGGVYVSNDAVFNMSGGTIAGCSAQKGGGVFTWGNMTMSGNSAIRDCTATIDGGGVCACNCAFSMAGSSVVSDCVADNGGGGVYTWADTGEVASFTMSDSSTISDCLAGANNSSNRRCGGGVCVEGNSCTFTMNGGSIDHNTGNLAGGVYFMSGNATLGGTAKISDNVKGGTPNNVYLPNDKYITLGNGSNGAAAPTNGFCVGVTTQTAPTDGNPVRITTNGASGDATYFASDSTAYAVKFATDHLELEVKTAPAPDPDPYYPPYYPDPTPEPTPKVTPEPVEDYAVSVESDKDSVQVSAKIEDGIATVEEITEATLEEIIEKKPSGEETGTTDDTTNSVTIDLSKAKQDVTGAELSKKSVENIADVVKDKSNSVDSVVIKMKKASVELDAKALEAVLESAEGDTVRVVVENTKAEGLNKSQSATLKGYDVDRTFEAYFESAGKRIHDFNGGKALVSLSFKPEKGKRVENYKVFYIDEEGKLQKMATKYENGLITFVTGHFSDYAVIYENVKDILLTKAKTTKKGYIKLSWNKIDGAEKYVVYGAKCGKSYKELAELDAETDGNSFIIKKISGAKPVSGKTYKLYVVAYDALGNKIKSKSIHYIVGDTSTKYANVKTITALQKTLELTVGEKVTVDAEYTMYEDKKHASKKHGKALRFTSDCPEVAKVAKDGTVTAKSEGKAVIYIQDIGGKWCTVEVTVKEK